MTASDYREILARLELTQIQAARLLGVDERTSRRWAIGERAVPPPAARFLRYLLLTNRSAAQAVRLLERH